MLAPLTLRDLAVRRNSIIFGLTVVAAVAFAGWLVYAFDYLQRVANGPEPVSLTQLTSMGESAFGRWFDVTAEVRPGHLLQTTTRRRRGGESITNHFALFKGKAVIVETSTSQLPPKFLAWASEFGPESEYYKRARSQLDKWAASTPNAALSPLIPFGKPSIEISPILLRTSFDVALVQNFTAFAIAAGAIGLLFMLWRTIRPLLDYTRTAPIAALRKSVRASEGLPALINDIDSQLATLDPTTRRSGSLLLPTWLLNVTKNSFSVMSSSDVVWVAPYTVTKKLYSIIPLSKSHEVRVIDRAGRIIALGVQEARFQEVLTAFYHWAPWAVVGSDPAMDARFGQKKGWRALSGFSKSTPSKTDLIKSIDKRREEIFANWAAQARAGEDASAQASSAQPLASATGRTR